MPYPIRPYKLRSKFYYTLSYFTRDIFLLFCDACIIFYIYTSFANTYIGQSVKVYTFGKYKCQSEIHDDAGRFTTSTDIGSDFPLNTIFIV